MARGDDAVGLDTPRAANTAAVFFPLELALAALLVVGLLNILPVGPPPPPPLPPFLPSAASSPESVAVAVVLNPGPRRLEGESETLHDFPILPLLLPSFAAVVPDTPTTRVRGLCCSLLSVTPPSSLMPSSPSPTSNRNQLVVLARDL